LNISNIIIRNFLSFDSIEIPFENYSVIVGPKASNKTNIVRILKFPSDKTTTINDKRLDVKSKFNESQLSSLWIDFSLNNDICLVWSQLAGIRTPPIVTTDFLYIRLIGDRTIQEKDLVRYNKTGL
jgi:AAA ATPase-like protein